MEILPASRMGERCRFVPLKTKADAVPESNEHTKIVTKSEFVALVALMRIRDAIKLANALMMTAGMVPIVMDNSMAAIIIGVI